MDVVLRGAVTYFAVWLVLRAAGKRSLSDITTFDFILLLIISETTQGALLNDDRSCVSSLLLVVTLVGIDVALSLWKSASGRVEKLLDGVPLLILADGIPLTERMARARVGADDILSAARKLRGLERLEQIKYAVLERNGGITIIPR